LKSGARNEVAGAGCLLRAFQIQAALLSGIERSGRVIRVKQRRVLAIATAQANNLIGFGNLFSADGLGSHLIPTQGVIMIRRFAGAAAVTVFVMLFPVAIQAQGVPGGVERGARDGERAAGPVGAVVGGVIGGVVGGVTGVLGVDERPRFRSYVVEQRRPSYEYREDLRVGAVLPEEGVTYYDVPPEYGVRGHRYTVVNGRTVLVEPRTRRVIEIVE
jgi:hypothetical protein